MDHVSFFDLEIGLESPPVLLSFTPNPSLLPENVLRYWTSRMAWTRVSAKETVKINSSVVKINRTCQLIGCEQ